MSIQSNNIGITDSVNRQVELLDGSFKHQNLTSLITNVVSGDVNGSQKPVATYVDREIVGVENLSERNAIDANDDILAWQRAHTPENFAKLYENEHYADGGYTSTVLQPRLVEDRIFFNSWEDLTNRFDVKETRVKALGANFMVADNAFVMKALLDPKVLRVANRDKYLATPTLADVELPKTQIFEVADNKEAMDILDLHLVNDACHSMNISKKILLMNRHQNTMFKNLNKEYLLHHDYVVHTDLRNLEQTVETDSFYNYIVENQYDKNQKLVFGLDESIMIAFNPTAFTMCNWLDKTICFEDPHADNEIIVKRKKIFDIKRTSDLGVVHVKLLKYAPKLETATVTAKANTAHTDVKAAITVNDNRINAQSWKATTKETWIVLKTATGTGSGEVVFDLTANTSGAARTGTITVVADGMLGGDKIVKTITIKQNA